jgi:hypothetical protein
VDLDLPEDLARLEARLAGRAEGGPDRQLRVRVLGAVRAELGRKASRRTVQRNFWRFAAAAAAAAFVFANFGASLTRGTDCGLGRRPVSRDLRAAARRIMELFPEMTEREAFRQTLLLEVGAPVAPLPVLHATPGDRHRVAPAKEG